MAQTRHTVSTVDGINLSLVAYDTNDNANLAVILPATGVSQLRYANFARYLALNGWSTVTFDYRGIGASAVDSSQQDSVSMQAWGEKDLTAVIDWITRVYGPRRLIAIGHSIGGQIIPLAKNVDRIDSMLAVAAQKGHWRLWGRPKKYLIYSFFKFYIPACVKLFGYVPMPLKGLHRLEKEAGLDYARWTMKLEYQAKNGNSLNARFANFRAPILALSIDDDTLYAPQRAVDYLMDNYYVNAPMWRCHLQPKDLGIRAMGHSGFFDPGICPKIVWDEVIAWIDRAKQPDALDDYSFRIPVKARTSKAQVVGHGQ